MTRWASGLGVLVAAVASVATSRPASPPIHRDVETTVTLSPQAPVAVVAFRVSSDGKTGGRAHAFAVARSDVAYRTLPGQDEECVAFDESAEGYAPPRAPGKSVAYACVPKGSAMPDVLFQVRERTKPERDFGRASTIDRGQCGSFDTISCATAEAPTCFDVSPDGATVVVGQACTLHSLESQCDGEAHCERVFEVRLIMRDRTVGSKTISLRGFAEIMSTGEDDTLSGSVDVVK